MFPYFALADIMPNLLLILVVSTAYMRGRMPGLLIGFFSGLLVDFMYGSFVIGHYTAVGEYETFTLIGIHALLYLLIGYFIGFTNRFYSNDDYTLPLIIIAVSDFIYKFIYYVIEFLLRGRLNFLFYLRRLIFPEIIYTVAVSIFLYKLLHMINNRLNRNPEKEV
jgi:rod shape-determining protein MreD